MDWTSEIPLFFNESFLDAAFSALNPQICWSFVRKQSKPTVRNENRHNFSVFKEVKTVQKSNGTYRVHRVGQASFSCQPGFLRPANASYFHWNLFPLTITKHRYCHPCGKIQAIQVPKREHESSFLALFYISSHWKQASCVLFKTDQSFLWDHCVKL